MAPLLHRFTSMLCPGGTWHTASTQVLACGFACGRGLQSGAASGAQAHPGDEEMGSPSPHACTFSPLQDMHIQPHHCPPLPSTASHLIFLIYCLLTAARKRTNMWLQSGSAGAGQAASGQQQQHPQKGAQKISQHAGPLKAGAAGSASMHMVANLGAVQKVPWYQRIHIKEELDRVGVLGPDRKALLHQQVWGPRLHPQQSLTHGQNLVVAAEPILLITCVVTCTCVLCSCSRSSTQITRPSCAGTCSL